MLGVMYFRGEGVAQNHKEAIKWYRMAAKQGHEIKDAEAQHFLALPLSSDSAHFRPLSNLGGRPRNLGGRWLNFFCHGGKKFVKWHILQQAADHVVGCGPGFGWHFA